MIKTIYLAIFFLLLVIPIAHGHEGPSSQDIIVDNFLVHVDITPYPVVTGQETTFAFEIFDAEGNSVAVENVNIESIREQRTFLQIDNAYASNITYSIFGEREIAFSWEDEAGTHDALFFFFIEPAPQNNSNIFVWIGAMIILVGLLAFAGLKKKTSWLNVGIFSVVIIITGSLGYSVFSFLTWEGNDGCLLQLGDSFVFHCHQELTIDICGEKEGFGWEKGDLDRAHTHKSDSRIHWHPPEAVKEPEKVQTLRNLFQDFNLVLNKTAIQSPKTEKIYRIGSEACTAGEVATLQVFIEENEEKMLIDNFLDYPLSDEVTIEIIYK